MLYLAGIIIHVSKMSHSITINMQKIRQLKHYKDREYKQVEYPPIGEITAGLWKLQQKISKVLGDWRRYCNGEEARATLLSH